MKNKDMSLLLYQFLMFIEMNPEHYTQRTPSPYSPPQLLF